MAIAAEQGGASALGALTYSVYKVREGYPEERYPKVGLKGCVGVCCWRKKGETNIPNRSMSSRNHWSLCVDRAGEGLA